MRQRHRHFWAAALLLCALMLCSTLASPVFVPQLLSEGVGRNIRHLPCVSRRTGETGVCMFAFTCARANGTHLGTCIDRFYFGSCCKIDDEPDIFTQDNTIDVDNTHSALPKPYATSSTVTTTTTTTAVESNDIPGNVDKVSPKPSSSSSSSSVKPTTIESTTIKTKPPKLASKKPTGIEATTESIRLSTFQTVQNASEQRYTTLPSTSAVVTTTRRTQRPSVADTKPTTITQRPRPVGSSSTVSSSKPDNSVSTLTSTSMPSTLDSSSFSRPSLSSQSTTTTSKRPSSTSGLTKKPSPSSSSSSGSTRPSSTQTTPRSPATTESPRPVTTLPSKTAPVTRFPPRNATTVGTPTNSRPVGTTSTTNKVTEEQLTTKPSTTRKPVTGSKKPTKGTTKRPYTGSKKPTGTATRRPPTLTTTTAASSVSAGNSTAAAVSTSPVVKVTTTTASAHAATTISSTTYTTTRTTTKKPQTTSVTKRPSSSIVTRRPATTTTTPTRITTTTRRPTTTPTTTTTTTRKNVTSSTSTRPLPAPSSTYTNTTRRPATTTTTMSAPPRPSSTPVTKQPAPAVIITKPTTFKVPSTTSTTTTTTTTAKPVKNTAATLAATTAPSTTTAKTTVPPTTTTTTTTSTTSRPVTSAVTTPTSQKTQTTSSTSSTTLSNEVDAELDKETTNLQLQSTAATPGIVTWTSLVDETETSTKSPEYSSIVPDTTETDWSPITTPDGWIIIQPPTTEKAEPDADSEAPSKPVASTSEAPVVLTKPATESTTTRRTTTTTTTTTTPTPAPTTTTTTQRVTTQSTTYVDMLSTVATVTVSPEFTDSPYAPINMSSFKEVCGRRLFPESRIVGGDGSTFGKWPWQISLRQWRTSTYLHKCGAALLNENWAITAAHCVQNVLPSDLLLRIGEHDLGNEEEPYGFQERRVQIVASHPSFDPRTFEFDLALMRFYEPVLPFQPNVLPICIPDDDEDYVGQTAFVTGWGRLYEDGPLPSVLQEVAVPVINNSVCEGMYRNAGYIEHIPHIFICAGWRKGGFDSCEGDSGGPLVIQRKKDRRWVLAGVISWGIGCAEPNQPGVYTRISEFREWINQILQF